MLIQATLIQPSKNDSPVVIVRHLLFVPLPGHFISFVLVPLPIATAGGRTEGEARLLAPPGRAPFPDKSPSILLLPVNHFSSILFLSLLRIAEGGDSM